jgi:hypothetical protein
MGWFLCVVAPGSLFGEIKTVVSFFLLLPTKREEEANGNHPDTKRGNRGLLCLTGWWYNLISG